MATSISKKPTLRLVESFSVLSAPSKPAVAEKSNNELLAILEEKTYRFDKSRDLARIKKAQTWARGFAKLTKTSTVKKDSFENPLVLPAGIVRRAKADVEMVLAAILYSSVRPSRGSAINTVELKEQIDALDIGDNISTLVIDTLRLRALKFVKPVLSNILNEQERKEKYEEHAREFRLAALWAVHDPRAIAIYGHQCAINLQLEIDKRGSFKPEKLEAMLDVVDNVLAPLAYLAGYGDLRKKLMDLSYKVRDPKGYEETCRIIKEAITDKQLAEIKAKAIAKHKEKFPYWREGEHFEVEIRPKSAASAKAKADRKKQKVSELGDLCAGRTILLKTVVGAAQDTDLNILEDEHRAFLIEELGKKDLLVLGELSHAFGRGNRKHDDVRPLRDEAGNILLNPDGTQKTENYSWIQERFAMLAQTEPRGLDPDRFKNPERFAWEQKAYPKYLDARHDDYITQPKASGYSAAQDTLFIKVGDRGEPVEIEWQVVDEFRHDVNTNGPYAGHLYFKTGMKDHVPAIEDWQRRKEAVMMGYEFTGRDHVYVLDGRTNAIVNISDNPTVQGFLAAVKDASREVCIVNGLEFPDTPSHTPTVTYGPHTALPAGCRVTPLPT